MGAREKGIHGMAAKINIMHPKNEGGETLRRRMQFVASLLKSNTGGAVVATK